MRLFPGVSVIFLLQVLLCATPIILWADWKVALTIMLVNGLAWMKAGGASTDRYVLERALQIMTESQVTRAEALLQAEAETRVNVDSWNER